MEVVVGVRVLGLQGEHRGVGGSIQLHHRLQHVTADMTSKAAVRTCMGSGRLMKYGGSSLTSFTLMMTRWLSVSATEIMVNKLADWLSKNSCLIL